MNRLIQLAGLIDALTERVGRAATWLVLAMTLVSTGNAIVRYLFDFSSNAFLEIQWYLFAALFLLCAGPTLKAGEHVRIDIVWGRLPARAQALIDILGTLFFLLPISILVLWLSIPLVQESYRIGEMSANAGGLLRWPVKALLPIGFALLVAQGISELIRRIAFLSGREG